MSNIGRIKRAGNTELTPAKLPIIGKIKVGIKVKNAKGVEYPTTLDYFRATGDYAVKFHEAFGEKPSTVGIIFMSDDINSVCNERYELRDTKSGSLIGSGDGENFTLWNGKEYDPIVLKTDAEKKVFSKKCIELSNNGKWMAILTISFIIPKIGSVMGYWKFETKGEKSSIQNIRDAFDMVKEFAGTVVNIPFDLQVKKVKSQRPGDSRLYPVVSLIPNVSKEKLDDVRSFLSQGNKIADLTRFLNDSQPLQLTEGNNEAETKKNLPAANLLDASSDGKLELFKGE